MTNATLVRETQSPSCASPEPTRPSLDATLAGLRADWQAVARYTVYRTEFRRADVILATGVDYPHALRLREEGEAHLRREPGYAPGRMGNPLISFRLEDPEGTQIAYRRLRAERGQREATGRT